MKQAINKWIGIALAVCMLVASAPIAGFVGFDSPAFSLGADFNHTANAAEVVASGTCGENLKWTLDNEGTLTISGTGKMANYSSTSSIPWHYKSPSIKKAVIADGVTSIGYSAFSSCDSLASITVDENNAYYSSDADGVLFNKDKTTLIQYPIGNTKTSYTIPDSVTIIGYGAFSGCTSLANITIPDSVTSIGDDAFYNTAYYNDESNWFDGVLYIDNCLIAAKTDISGAYVINNGTKVIAGDAFYYCEKLVSVTIPDSVTSIGNYAFSSCDSLASITIPDSVTIIGNRAFYACTNLVSITVNADNANYSSDADGVLFNKDKTTLIQYPIGNARTSYTIPDSVTSIGSSAFYYCPNLASVTFGENSQLTSIGDSAFAVCTNLASITIPDSVTNIGNQAFESCYNLASVTFGENSQLTSIGYFAFEYCTSLASITIPDSVKSIGNYAFSSCDSLESITIPDSVTNIGNSAFSSCRSLASITIPDSVTSIGRGAFYNTAYYNDKSNWLNGVLYIDKCLIGAKTNISGAYVINNDTRVIASGAFFSCDSLESVTFGENSQLTSIGNYAFSLCTSLASITIPDSVTSIGDDAFYNTAYYNDKSNWLNGVLYIDKCLIGAKTNISGAYVINNDTRVITSGAFSGCASLESVTMPDSVTEITYGAFRSCTSLTEITIPDSVTSISDQSFNGCSSLASITIPNRVTTIGGYAFSTCLALSDVYYIGSEKEWNAVDIGPENDSLLNATIHFVDMTPSFSDSEIVFVNEDGNLVSRVGTTAEDLLALAGEDASLVNNKGETLAEPDKIGTGAVLTLADGTRYEIIVLGDIDGDGNITAGDARSALRNSVGLDALAGVYLKAAKVNGEGPVNAGDARSILRASVGLDNPDEWYEKAAG